METESLGKPISAVQTSPRTPKLITDKLSRLVDGNDSYDSIAAFGAFHNTVIAQQEESKGFFLGHFPKRVIMSSNVQ